MTVRRVPLTDLGPWGLEGEPLRLAHSSGRFFTIEGIRVETNFGPIRRWEQPIVRQPEIGILGIVTRVRKGVRSFLMQAKAEPGNVNGVQLSPTVQATVSNYTRVHGGRSTPFLECFIEPGRARVLLDQIQTEQGARFLRKRNRNMIVEVDEVDEPGDNFRWLTLAELKQLLRCDNEVGMDTRSVLSCLPFVRHEDTESGRSSLIDQASMADPRAGGFARDLLRSASADRTAQHTDGELGAWISALRQSHTLSVTERPIDELEGWAYTGREIRHESGEYFSVIGVDVEAHEREVARWQQPLLSHSGYGLVGFLLRRFDGLLHFLVGAYFFPGIGEGIEVGPTVACSRPERYLDADRAPRFLDLFREPPGEWVRYSAAQSEEGGRFHHFQNRYVFLEPAEDLAIEPAASHRWMTLRQIQEFVARGELSIEGRNLLSCLDLGAPAGAKPG